MGRAGQVLSANEAASVTGVPLKQVNRIVDAGLLHGAVDRRAGARVIMGDGLVGLRFAHETAGLLTVDARRRLVQRLLERPGAKVLAEKALTVDLRPIAEAVRRGLSALEKARKMVTADKGVLGGAPCFRGTRIPVHDVAAMIANGDPMDAVVAGYPLLMPEQVELAIVYAEAYPRRGRPRRSPARGRGRPVSTETFLLRDLPRAS